MTSTQTGTTELDDLYGRIWQKRELPDRDRHLVAIIASTHMRSKKLATTFVRSALQQELLTGNELQEVMLAGAVYLGFPAVGTVLRPAMTEAALDLGLTLGDPLLLSDPARRHDLAVPLWESVHAVPLRPMDDLLMSATVDFVCGEVYSRPGLSMRDRRLIAITILAAQGLPAAVTVHVRAALANEEWDAESLEEVALLLAAFVGLPQADVLARAVQTEAGR
jgi:4-carboxymuconolactone decarboxylase